MSETIDTPWGASVFGAASVQAAPDVARLRMSINEMREQPAEAFDAVRAAITSVRQALRAHNVSDSAVSTSQLNLKSVWRYVESQQVFAGYTCGASFAIELDDVDILESVLVDVVAAGANEVDRVTFDVRAKPRLRAEARSAAVVAAREKARQYATAAGMKLGPVVHIKDIDAEQLGGYRGHGQAAQPIGDGDLLPGNVSVSAGVVLGFSLITA
jgi:hypothetical protein